MTINCQILYVVYENPLYGYGMIFSHKGMFEYAIKPDDVKIIKEQKANEYVIIDPNDKVVYHNNIEEQSINKITAYFNQVYKEKSCVTDSLHIFSKVFSVITKDYCFLNKRILDYGSGYNSYSRFFTDSEYVGFDIRNNTDVDTLENNYFDYVLCNFVLEHVANPETIIEHISKKLKIGGTVIISIPALSFWEFIKSYFLKQKLELPIFHYRTFSYVNFRKCVSFNTLKQYLKNYNIFINSLFSVSNSENGMSLIKKTPFRFFGEQVILVGEKYG